MDTEHPLDTDISRLNRQHELHRWLAIDLNNRAWTALDAGEVDATSSPVERERLLYGAYASAYHWLEAGTPINQARAEHLVARVALRVGRPEIALHHARRCLELVESHPAIAEDWDLAFALEALARASAADGDPDGGRELRARAGAAAAAVADPEERALVEAELAGGEWFGLV